jgi:hypothetical protein
MLTLVAFVVVHVRVDAAPAATDVGLAANVIVGAVAVAVIVTLWVAVPPAPVAVAV